VRRLARPRPGKIAADPVLRQFVAERLEKRWSPEQVSQALRREFPDEPARHVVHETIYQAVYRPELGGLSRELPARVLRTRRRRRRPHRRPGERRPNGIIAMAMLDQRPAEAVRGTLIAAMAILPPRLRQSLTWDQGKEMALHTEISAALGMPVYFRDKASPRLTVAAAIEREHQRAAPPVLPQGK